MPLVAQTQVVGNRWSTAWSGGRRRLRRRPETWGEYNARLGGALVRGAAWDGLLVDRSDGDQSWLVGNSTARSIDPDRSNTPVSDGYAAFDAAWNAGLRLYEERLRAAVGDKLVYVNWGHPDCDLLNGRGGRPQGRAIAEDGRRR